jgi:hypothetical protein
MSDKFTLIVTSYAAFGALATLRLPRQPARRFTFAEAAIVARALEAVAQGASAETQIYMSPIASDQDFDARVEQEGVVIVAKGCEEARLGWDESIALAEALKRTAALLDLPA